MVTRDDNHVYHDEAGNVVPGVTTILKATGFMDTRYFSNYARDRGTAVHLACEYDDKGILDDETVDEAIQGYVMAWRNFKNTVKFQPETMEVMVHNKTYNYAGQYDVTGTIDGRKFLIDRKTGKLPAYAGIQLAAYSECLEAEHIRMAVELHDNGTFRTQTYSDASDWGVFMAALTVYNWKERNGMNEKEVIQ